jgi:hypothetical protein
VAAAFAAAAVASTLVLAPTAQATSNRDRLGTDLYVLTSDGRLTLYSGDDIDKAVNEVTVSGLDAGERLVGLDMRPANGALYAMSDRNQLYRIDGLSGAASKVGTPVVMLNGVVGFDFNPTVDRIRIVTSSGQNLRLNPDTGAVAGTDTTLAYAATDANAGRMPMVSGAGYTNSVAGATSTLLYDIDYKRNVLVTQGTAPGVTPVVGPNTGQLFTVGRLGIPASAINGFDIAGEEQTPGVFDPADYTAVASTNFGPISLINTVDLETGRSRIVEVVKGKIVGLTFAAN